MTAIANLIQQQTATPGTGPYTLTPVVGRQTFDSAFGHGTTTNVFYVFMMNEAAAQFMWGKAHLSAANTLVIDTVLGGSNGTSPVSFSAGTIDITNALPAEKHIYPDDNGNTAFPGQLAAGTSLYPSLIGPTSSYRYDTAASILTNSIGAKYVMAGAPAVDNSSTWLNDFISGIDVKGWVTVYGTSPVGAIGGAFASRGSDNPTANDNIIGSIAMALHDNTLVDQYSWGNYTLGIVTATAHGGNHINEEHTVYNQKTAVKLDPFNVNPAGAVTGIRVDSGNGGGGISGATPTSCSNAFDIVNNGAAFLSGIVFQNTSLDTAADSHPDAIALPPAYAFSWYSAAATRIWQLYSNSGANGDLNLIGSGTGNLNIGANAQLIKSQNSGLSLIVNNTNTGSSATANIFAVTNAGTFGVSATSTAGGSASQFQWTGAGPMLFDAINAAGNMLFRTGATPTQAMTIDANQNVQIGTGVALATGATNGFLYIPSGAGTPTGTPTSKTGAVPIRYDTTANKLWVYNGAWKSIALT